jgi:VCBS repeat-containing protein
MSPRDSASVFMRNSLLLSSVVIALLSGCGGKDNNPPIANPQSFTGAEDTATTGTLQGTDPDNDPLSYSVVVQAAHGSVTVQTSGAFQYQPAANFNGNDSFQFQVKDPSGATAKATITLTVTPVNDPPTLTAAIFNGVLNSNISGNIVGNDVDGDTLIYAVVANPTHGILLSFDADGTFTYRPNTGFSGSDSFTASAKDPSGTTATGVFTLRVDGPPQANNDFISVATGNPVVVDVLANDTDPDGDNLSVQITSAPTTGAATVTADNHVSLTVPDGFRGFTRFSYRATDPSGLSATSTAVVFVGTPVSRLAWIGDEFTPGTRDIAVSDFIDTWAADDPLPQGETLDAFSVIFRVHADRPAVGFNSHSGNSYWAALDAAHSTQLVASGSTSITDIDIHDKYALYSQNNVLSLATLDGENVGPVALNPPNYCGGAFGPLGLTVFLGCTAPVNSFPSPTLYWLQLSEPSTVVQLTPALYANGGPNPPAFTPDGTSIVYDATRTDSSGTFDAVFMVRLSAPGQEIQISPRFGPTEGAFADFRFTPGGKKLLYSGYSTSDPGFCDLYVYDMINGGLPVKVNGPHASASCPMQYDLSPDGSRVVYVLPPPGQPTQAALYETPLSSPGTANTIFGGGFGYYSEFRYDESGTNIVFTGSTAVTPSTLYEWHRADGSQIQLSANGEVVDSFAHSDDWTMIAYTSRNSAFVDEQRLLNRSVPGQSVQISNQAATSGVVTNDTYFITR